jgi:hypothetical protein
MRPKAVLAVIAAVFVGLVAYRIWRYSSHGDLIPAMPRGIDASAEQALYLTPSGLYSMDDIEANGRILPSDKFRMLKARHDFNPQPGDRLCPITRTKSNPECTWIVGGRTYEFCCPPCIDEFVQLAKSNPDQVEPPAVYVRP